MDVLRVRRVWCAHVRHVWLSGGKWSSTRKEEALLSPPPRPPLSSPSLLPLCKAMLLCTIFHHPCQLYM
jgi:hypothetical protein